MQIIDDVVQVDVGDGVAVVTLNRPAKLNAINASVRDRLLHHLPELDSSTNVKAIVLTGSGQRAFSAGQDMEETAAIGPSDIAGWLNHQYAMFQSVRNVNKPIIAALNGIAVGAGFQIALMCDLRVAHSEVALGQPEVKVGLASIIGSYLISLQVGHSLNQQLSLTGEPIFGERASQLGLINELVTIEEVLPRAIELASRLAAQPAVGLRMTKQRFRERTQADFDETWRAAIRYQLECFSTDEPRKAMQRFVKK